MASICKYKNIYHINTHKTKPLYMFVRHTCMSVLCLPDCLTSSVDVVCASQLPAMRRQYTN